MKVCTAHTTLLKEGTPYYSAEGYTVVYKCFYTSEVKDLSYRN